MKTPDGKFYRPSKFTSPQRIDVTDTPSTISGWAFEGDESSCKDCGAAYGHKIFCPKINRQSAEAASSLLTPTEADKIRARGLGVAL